MCKAQISAKLWDRTIVGLCQAGDPAGQQFVLKRCRTPGVMVKLFVGLLGSGALFPEIGKTICGISTRHRRAF